MASNWPLVKLSECASFQEGYVNPSQKKEEYFGDEIKWLRATDLNNGSVFETSRRLSKVGFESAGKSALLFEPETIAISKSGTIGRVGILKDYMCGNRAVINVKVDPNVADNKFIFYVLRYFRPSIELLAMGSVQPNLYTSALGTLEFNKPDLKTQKSISKILGALDDKIELNSQTNQTLEQMAQALFKSWFVDFDPVFDNALASGVAVSDFPEALQKKAKQRLEQRQQFESAEPSATYKADVKPLPVDTLNLFPSEFEQTDEPSIGINGWIPKGWFLCELSHFIKFANGKAKKSSDKGKYPIYGANGIIGQTDESRFNNAVIVGRVGAYCGAIEYCRNDFWASDNTIVATSKLSEEHIPHILYLLKFLDLNQYAGGAAQPLLNQTTLNRLKIPFSSVECMMQFNNIIDGFLLKQVKNNEQNKELAKIRDILLPKLISGELTTPTTKDCA
ncbi:restriction endonuclease subunit S [Litorilituus sediminis]|uniref:Restriction endonuclease subunit S n=1 Tax=Litorilituus sediminis TaxID=718192 RepID=A0A4P6P0V5_9GAMM|nr:restriction endonuclease subunit S [Litorilituus sediminis]QBG34796.1 restriction endonuclease subunit S [Litorilituus sediminis]